MAMPTRWYVAWTTVCDACAPTTSTSSSCTAGCSLRRAREAGKVRFIGFTAEEPWTARPLIASGAFDVVQLRYNLIYQSDALHALTDARDAGLGVAVMRR